MSDVIDFEREFGSTMLLKAGLSTVNRLLVDTGLVTENEIKKTMSEEIKKIKHGLPKNKKQEPFSYTEAAKNAIAALEKYGIDEMPKDDGELNGSLGVGD
jgi:hypothetical protein